MTREANRNRNAEQREEYFGNTSSESDLSALGHNPSATTGQNALSASMASGRAMQNSVIQTQNAQSISHAQTATGVTSLLKQKPKRKPRNMRTRIFLELFKAL